MSDAPIEIVVVTRGGNLSDIYVPGGQGVVLHHLDFYKDTSKKPEAVYTYTMEPTAEQGDTQALLRKLKGEEEV